MKLRIKTMLILFGVVYSLLLLQACRTKEGIYKVEHAPVTSTKGATISNAQVKRAILQACASLGWQARVEGPGVIVATLNIRTHMAQVEITYNTSTYSIVYKDSKNLNYTGTGIHSNYTGWIQRLDNMIKANLAVY